jgi:hypothetical protein
MEFEFVVHNVKFFVDAEDADEAHNEIDTLLADVAYDWGQVSLV